MGQKSDKAWSDYLNGNRLERGEDCAPDRETAALFYRRAAFRGLPEAQQALAFMCATGQGVERDEAQAVSWFRAAAEQGHISAQHNLGVMYAEGRGVERDEQEAVRWFYRAALGGSADARSWLDEQAETG